MLNLDNADGDADTSKSSKTVAQRDDESSQLLALKNSPAVFIEPPYSAPLAPFDMELVKKFRIHDKLIARDSAAGRGNGRGKQNERRDTTSTTLFMNNERESEAGKNIKSSNESLSLPEKRARFAER